MAARVFAGIRGRVDLPEVSRDFEESTKLDKVRIGRLGVFFRDGFKIRFMEYSLFERVFIRVQQVNLKTC